MEWDLSRVYTAVNADELKIGSKIVVGNTIGNLKELVEQNMSQLSDLTIIDNIYSDRRFIVNRDTDRVNAFAFAYLVSESEEKKLKWTDLKIGDVIRKKDGTSEGMVIQIDKDGGDDVDKDCHICCGLYITDEELAEWEKVE